MKYELTRAEKEFVNAYLISKNLPINFNVTFSDIPLTDEYSDIRSRSEIFHRVDSFETQLTPGVILGIPIILANMDSLCGVQDKERGVRPGALAIAEMEKYGALGMPPPMPIEDRLAMLDLVGRTDCAFIHNPLTISPEKTLLEAKQLMGKHNIQSLIVIDREKRPVGILSTRDWRYETDLTKLVKDLMGGKRKLYVAPRNVSFEEAARILRKHRIEKLPLINKNGRLAGLITAHGLFYKNHYPRAIRDDRGRFLRVGSVGVGYKFGKQHLYEVEAQVKRGICMILIDTARAFSINAKEALEAVKKHFPKLPVMIGNTCNPAGVKFLFDHGADVVKVGIGPGNACTTRRTGIGMPQLSAVAKACAIARMDTTGKRKIVADGGIGGPDDVLKATMAGADAVMIGRLFIGTEESAARAEIVQLNNDLIKGEVKVKSYEGSASLRAQVRRLERGDLDSIREPEGRTQLVPVVCTMRERIASILRLLSSAMSYRGIRKIGELREHGVFEDPQSFAGFIEGVKRK